MPPACAVLAALALLPFALAAAPPSPPKPPRPHRTGFWVEFASGPGYVRVASSNSADPTTSTGSSGYFRLGGTLSNRVLLGVESFGLTDETFGFAPEDPSLVAETASLTAVVLWFPWRSGVFFKGGVGMAEGEFTVTPRPGERVTATGTGVGLTFGVGFDLPLSRKLALTANAATAIAAIGDLILPAVAVDDVIATMYQLTVGLTFR